MSKGNFPEKYGRMKKTNDENSTENERCCNVM